MEIAMVVYPEFTPLDLIGPYQVLAALPGARVLLYGAARGPVRSDAGMQVVAERAFGEAAAVDLLVVPGTGRPEVPLADAQLIDWLRATAPRCRRVASVCTGALLLGAAGLLRGRRATTHWMARQALAGFGATAADERVVFDGPVATAAGVSAGIDLALRLAAEAAGELAAQAIELAVEYDPDPPFRCGSLRSAPGHVVAAARASLRAAAGRGG